MNSKQASMLKLQYFGHLRQRANSLAKTLTQGKTEGRRRRGRQRLRWLDGITDSMDMGLGGLGEMAKDMGLGGLRELVKDMGLGGLQELVKDMGLGGLQELVMNGEAWCAAMKH